MGPMDLPIIGLYGAALLFTCIELGLSAYAVWYNDQVDWYYYIGAGYYIDLNNTLGARVDFLLFASVWTLVISIVLIVFTVTFKPRGDTTQARPWLSFLTLGLNAVTMIFWLAGFAAWVDIPWYLVGIVGAIAAFAILLWLVFLALLIINILTAVGVFSSKTPGYGSMSKKSTLP